MPPVSGKAPRANDPAAVWPPVQTSPGKSQKPQSKPQPQKQNQTPPPRPPVRPPPPRTAPPQPPKVVVIHQQVPVIHPMPVMQQMPQAVKKGGSGCGCLIVILILIAVVIAIVANSQSRTWEAIPESAPPRPTMTNSGLTYSTATEPDIVSSSVVAHGTTMLDVNLKVRSGDEEKFLVAVYLTDPQSEAVKWSNPAAAGRWVEMPFFARKTRSTANLNIPIAVPPGAAPTRLQISIFNSNRQEVRRQVLEVPPLGYGKW
jgi:hypothetical protein